MPEHQNHAASPWKPPRPTAVLALADGQLLYGMGLGATGQAVGEVCFNTAMTGYQEILTDPSYFGQIVCFTFPHIGNVGTNDEDVETTATNVPAALGCIVRADVTAPSNYRAALPLQRWLKDRGIIGMCGVDTRALTRSIRERGLLHAVVAHNPEGRFDTEALIAEAARWPGLEGMDLAREVASTTPYDFQRRLNRHWLPKHAEDGSAPLHVVAIDYGIKNNILELLTAYGCRVSVVAANESAEAILARKPEGIFLSNGPGDPAATGVYAEPVIRELVETGLPVFGICLGHQMLARALGGKTRKMHQGHHGANHPVKDLVADTVEITSMNHGFAVDGESLPEGVHETHRSLFDGSNAGLALADKPVFSVQFHPEASPGPRDGHAMFARFVNHMRAKRGLSPLPESTRGRL